MVQSYVAFLMACCMLAPGAMAAEAAAPSPAHGASTDRPRPSVEERFLGAQDCLNRSDQACAEIALAGMNPASAYAKLLEARLAAGRQDYDAVLRLLLPLQAESGLLPAALGSLHATLALAYENEQNPLRALEHRALADPYLAPQEAAANQKRILDALTARTRDELLEIRGESADTAVQGWIDLALALAHSAARRQAVEQWRRAYPDHAADDHMLQSLLQAAQGQDPGATLAGKVALLLPLDVPTFAFAAEAVRSGFLAARDAAGSSAEITVYPTHGLRDEIPELYRQAVAAGAQYVIGPLTRAEVAALQQAELVTVPTVALNTLEDAAASIPKLVQFGLPVEDEAGQLARFAQAQGMQTAIVAAADTALAQRMAQAFVEAWTEAGGVVVLQAEFAEQADPLALKAQIAAEPADMIFLAADAERARRIRPYLNAAIPTFGLSHLYDGEPSNPLNGALDAIRFVDMPWLLNPDDPQYARYREAAASLAPSAQRWFAVGVDAWNILADLAAHPEQSLHLRGLTGNLTLGDNRVQRELPMAQFRGDGIHLE